MEGRNIQLDDPVNPSLYSFSQPTRGPPVWHKVTGLQHLIFNMTHDRMVEGGYIVSENNLAVTFVLREMVETYRFMKGVHLLDNVADENYNRALEHVIKDLLEVIERAERGTLHAVSFTRYATPMH